MMCLNNAKNNQTNKTMIEQQFETMWQLHKDLPFKTEYNGKMNEVPFFLFKKSAPQVEVTEIPTVLMTEDYVFVVMDRMDLSVKAMYNPSAKDPYELPVRIRMIEKDSNFGITGRNA